VKRIKTVDWIPFIRHAVLALRGREGCFATSKREDCEVSDRGRLERGGEICKACREYWKIVKKKAGK